MNTSLGETIRDLRIEKRLKQKELAVKAQVAVGYLSQIEKGTKTPSLDMIDRICFAMDIPVEHIIIKAGLEKEVAAQKRLLYRELKPYFEKFDSALKALYVENNPEP